ncbi:hypothetical protein FOL47_001991 [Perkinsus chesapeaki]|uniref:Uncharacterized protein n=1 Tax=Perkinsus chesapeaki TaxID=330153 RepID=A0A7J6MGC8_PERCH|nr:hypothetical protein FOL47_001991 [Perkinsus chesapeaki]
MPAKRCSRETAGESRLPVVVVESHTSGLASLHLAIRRQWLADENLEVFHVDAHPDLAASKALGPEDIFGDPVDLYTKLENDVYGISGWLLPSVLQGHVGRVVWCRPTWAHQLPDCHPRKLQVGFKDGRMRVWSGLHYWLHEGEGIDGDSKVEPEDPSASFELEVGRAASLSENAAAPHRSGWILDVDLDYFSCFNPVPEECPTLPSHESSDDEISRAFAELEKLLPGRYSCPPGIVIISRSGDDGFTPSDKVDELQRMVVGLVNRLYGSCRVIHITSTEDFYHLATLGVSC